MQKKKRVEMFRNIMKGYGKAAVSIGKFLLLFGLCGVIGFLIVYPLWKFAVTWPGAYTWTVLTLIAGILIVFAVLKMHRYLNPTGEDLREKKQRMRGFLLGVAKAFVCIGGFVLFVAAVLAAGRLAGLGVFILVVVVYGILAFGNKRETAESN
ncbi:MAG: hypothetical protein LBU99_00785 [Spirochaetaceae bacterium]|jgi:hypothetical protein|nr:hypothetical protein [Spirochaetaceae bacterium]